MRRVQILSPFRGATPADQRRNVAYAQAALLDCLTRDEAPFAPHLLYPDVLDDSDPVQRAQGIEAGLEWMTAVDAAVVYTDLGISVGMAAELRAAEVAGIPVERRSLPGWVSAVAPICPHGVSRSFPCMLCEVVAPATQELPVVTLEEPDGL